MENIFKNKNVVVTGGCVSIGLGIVERFLKHGSKVIATYNNSYNEAENLSKYYRQKNIDLEVMKLDLSSLDGTYKFLNQLKKHVDKIDILVNNSGICYIDPLIFQEDSKIINMINVNFTNTIILTKNIIKDFMEENCKVINISSVWGNVGSSCEAVYSATKGGINLFTMSMSKEMYERKIKFISIAPGIIDTKINSHLGKEEVEEIIKEIPLGRIGKVEDVVNAVEFFSREDVNITGETICVDGGWTI